MVKRNTKNKKKMTAGGWKEVRDMYDPVHKEIKIPPEKERLSESSHVKNVSVPHRKSPRSRHLGDTHTLTKLTKWEDVKPERMTLKNIYNLVEDNRHPEDINPDEVIISEESKRESDGDDTPEWVRVNPYSLRLSSMKRGGAKRKSKSSKKKQKRKHSKQRKTSKSKTQKRKSSNKRKYTKRR
jgi:hypothetical protein